MSRYEVTTDIIVHCRITLEVEADSKEDAIDAAAECLPNNYDPDRAKAWNAKITIKAPRGVKLKSNELRAHHFEQASGSDKARKIAEGR